MSKANIALLLLLIASATGLVTSQHQARKLFAELEREQQITKQIETEWSQLQIEQSTWGMPSRIEKIAVSRLRMTAPKADHVNMIPLIEKVGTGTR
jgi:cell division protein FtsL